MTGAPRRAGRAFVPIAGFLPVLLVLGGCAGGPQALSRDAGVVPAWCRELARDVASPPAAYREAEAARRLQRARQVPAFCTAALREADERVVAQERLEPMPHPHPLPMPGRKPR